MITKRSFSPVGCLIAAGLLTVGLASAGTVTLTPLQIANPPANDPDTLVPFPTAGDAYYSFTNGSGTIPGGGGTAFQWTAGDYVISDIFTLPTDSVTDLSANWSFQDYLGGDTETWYVYVNGTAVAQAVLPDDSLMGDTLTVTGTVNFAGIAPVAGGYQVELILQNTVPDGDGSVSWLDGGTTDLSYDAAPEPGTLTMLGAGLMSLVALRRKLAR